MNEKRNLFTELNITAQNTLTQSPLDLDIPKMKLMVNNRILSVSSERSVNIMKYKKRFPVIAAAVTLIFSITTFATSGIVTSWTGSSASRPDFTKLPTTQECMKNISFSPILIETFHNGYQFKSGYIVNNDFRDEDYNSLENFKSLKLSYEKNDDEILFNQRKYNSQIKQSGKILATIEGTDIYYNTYINKVVPENYEMTTEDKKAEENGEMIFSYGSDTIKIVRVQGISWTEDSIDCVLMQIDGKLSPDGLVEMAEEIIIEY